MPDTEQLVSEATAPGGSEESLLSPAATDELAGKIGQQLFDAGATDDEPTPKPKEELVKEDDGEVSEPEAESKEDEGTPPEGEDKGEDKPKDGDEEAVPVESGSTLPAAYRRSMKSRQWSDEEIAALEKGDPDRALEVAERIHIGRNQEIAEYARLGREAQTATAGPAEQAPVAAAPVPAGGLARIDTEAMISQLGGQDELVNHIAGPVNQAIDAINQMLPRFIAGTEAMEEAQNVERREQIETFLGSEDLKPYAKVYGDLKDGLSLEQQRSRKLMLEQADALRAGAASQGRMYSVEDALADAHASVSSEFQAEAIRTEIKSKVEQRAASVSVKPQGHGKSGGKKDNTREGLEKRVGASLAEALG